MDPKRVYILAAILVGIVLLLGFPRMSDADQPKPVPTYEYVTIRWAGRDNTHIVRPGGAVEFIGMELRKKQKPDRADDRAFYMNLTMNGLTKDGYEFAGMSSDEIVMKRSLRIQDGVKPEEVK